MLVSGVAADKNTARISVLGVKDEPGIAFRLFNLLARYRINVDIIIQSVGRDNRKDISLHSCPHGFAGNHEDYKRSSGDADCRFGERR